MQDRLIHTTNSSKDSVRNTLRTQNKVEADIYWTGPQSAYAARRKVGSKKQSKAGSNSQLANQQHESTLIRKKQSRLGERKIELLPKPLFNQEIIIKQKSGEKAMSHSAQFSRTSMKKTIINAAHKRSRTTCSKIIKVKQHKKKNLVGHAKSKALSITRKKALAGVKKEKKVQIVATI